MKIDLHCHSKYSYDNFLEPEAIIEQALSMKLDGICFTEHHSIMASLPVKKIKVPKGFVVLRGIEISTSAGHLLAYGLKDDSWNKWSGNNYLDIISVIKNIHDLGGICAPAHPFRGWDSLGEMIFEIDGFDAIETHNGFNPAEANLKAMRAASEKKIPSIGGSDCHQRHQVGRAFTVFDRPVATIDDLVREIKNGNCRGTLYDHV